MRVEEERSCTISVNGWEGGRGRISKRDHPRRGEKLQNRWQKITLKSFLMHAPGRRRMGKRGGMYQKHCERLPESGVGN